MDSSRGDTVFLNKNYLTYEQMNVKEDEITVTDVYTKVILLILLNGNMEK